MGSYYLTVQRPGEKGEYKNENGVESGVYSSPNEVFLAFSQKKVGVHAMIKMRLPEHKTLKGEGEKEFKPGMVVKTTVGRVVFNDILKPKMPYYNLALGQKQLQGIIADCYQLLGRRETIDLLDAMKDIGFRESTRSGLSFATERPQEPRDRRTPSSPRPRRRSPRPPSSTRRGSSPSRSGTARCSTPGPTPARRSPRR